MNKTCYICGNDWCLNLFDDPINPEENYCDSCNHAPLTRRCPACSQSPFNKKNIFFLIEWYISLSFLIILIGIFISALKSGN